MRTDFVSSIGWLKLILFAVLGLLLMCSSNDLLTAYLSIELSSLAFYILTSFRKISSYSVESGIKYFVTGAVSSAFFLLGSSYIYGLTGSINFSDFFFLFECSTIDFYSHDLMFGFYRCCDKDIGELIYNYYDFKLLNSIIYFQNVTLDQLFCHTFVEFGLTLVLFSLFIKLALAPFHLWGD